MPVTLAAWAQGKWHTQAQWAPEWSRGSIGRGTFSKWRKTKFSCWFAALHLPDTFLPTIFLSRLHLSLRPVNVHLPALTQKGFFIRNLGITWLGGICCRRKDNFELPRQVSSFGNLPLWAVLTWISAGIKHNCFLGIMLGESSINMIRGEGGWMKILSGGSENF